MSSPGDTSTTIPFQTGTPQSYARMEPLASGTPVAQSDSRTAAIGRSPKQLSSSGNSGAQQPPPPPQITFSPSSHSLSQSQLPHQYKHHLTSSASPALSARNSHSNFNNNNAAGAGANNNRLLDVENGLSAMSTVAASQLERKTALQSAHFWKMLSDVRNRSLNRAKLKQSSQVSALLSGFALVGMVEMDVPKETPFGLLLFFIVVTTALVSVHMIALMISTCILPHIESINEMEERASSSKYFDYMSVNSQTSASRHDLNDGGPGGGGQRASIGACRNDSSRSSHEKMAFYITIAWSCSTVIGIFLFIVELAVIVWVKFYGTSGGTTVALVSSLMLVPVLASLIFFAFHFYRKLVAIRYEFTEKVMNDVNLLADELA